MSLLTWAFPILEVWFPRTFAFSQTEAREELCEVIHVLSRQEDLYDLENQLTGAKFITLQDRNGARGVLYTGMLKNEDPLTGVKVGDKLLVSIRPNKYLPFEMKILKASEIYAQGRIEPIILAA
jgi:hypothetical protein